MDLCQLYSIQQLRRASTEFFWRIFSDSLRWWYVGELVSQSFQRFCFEKKNPPISHAWVVSSFILTKVSCFFKAWPLFSLTYCWFTRNSNLAWMLFAAHPVNFSVFSQAVTSILDLCCGSGVQGIVALRHYASNASFVVGKHGPWVSLDTFHHLFHGLVPNSCLRCWQIQVDSCWLKDDLPRTMEIWSSELHAES